MTEPRYASLCQSYFPYLDIDYKTAQIDISHDLNQSPTDRQANLWVQGCFNYRSNRLSGLFSNIAFEASQKKLCLEDQQALGYSKNETLRGLQEEFDLEFCEEQSKTSVFYKSQIKNRLYGVLLNGVSYFMLDRNPEQNSNLIQDRATKLVLIEQQLNDIAQQMQENLSEETGLCLLKLSAQVHQEPRTKVMIEDMLTSAVRYCQTKSSWSSFDSDRDERFFELRLMNRRLKEFNQTAQKKWTVEKRDLLADTPDTITFD